jgi:4-hydroxybenzoate polyprenyltransferase
MKKAKVRRGGLFKKIILYSKFIKFSHSVFALPFAFTGALFAANGIPSAKQILWIIIAMVSARSGAMALNRIIDWKIDSANPRTSSREIPTGKVKITEAVIFAIVSFAVFVFAAYMLNPLCFRLAPFAIAVLALYPYTKRFTSLSHFVLGIALSMAPVGAWIAIRGTLDFEIIPLAVSVIFWLAGFDVIYALQDLEFDKSFDLYSIPRKIGIKNALVISAVLHLIAGALLVYTGTIFLLGLFYWIGIIIAAMLFIYEHAIIKPSDLSRLDVAFFNMNGYISVTVFVFTLLDYVI